MNHRRGHLRPLPTTHGLLARAMLAYNEAEYDRCRELIALAGDGAAPERAGAALLRAELARVENRVGDWYDDAREAARDLPDPHERLVALALQAGAAKRLGRHDEAATLRASAERELSSARRPNAAIARANYILGADALEDRDYERVEMYARRNLDAKLGLPGAYVLLGWIEHRRERYASSVPFFTKALAALRESGEPDRRLESRTIVGLSIVAADTIDLTLGRKVRREYEQMGWTASLRYDQSTCLINMRFLALLEGDLERAWLLAREVSAVADNAAHRAVAEIYGAVSGRLLGDRAASRIQFRRAWELLRDEKWSTVGVEPRGALMVFATEVGTAMPAEARKAVTLYQSLKAKSNPAMTLEGDRRVEAQEQVAVGRVREILGEPNEAIEHYGRALEIWTAVGYTMRAALAALDLWRLTGERTYRKPVEAAVKRAPNAWFASELRARSSPLERLSPAERLVLVGLLEGKSAKRVGADLDRSHYTVTNHTRKILRAFGVTTRPILLAKCVELGITADDVRVTLPKTRPTAGRPPTARRRR